MNTLQQLQCLITEVGSVLGEIERIERTSENVFVVVFDEETAIEAEVNEADDKLQLTMLLGPTPPDRRSEMYALLLTYNFLRGETGGFFMALDGPEGSVYLLLDICDLDLELHQLAQILATMLGTGRTWRRALTADQPTEDESAEPEVGDAIKV